MGEMVKCFRMRSFTRVYGGLVLTHVIDNTHGQNKLASISVSSQRWGNVTRAANTTAETRLLDRNVQRSRGNMAQA